MQYDNLISRSVIMRIVSFVTGCAITVGGFCVSELGASEQVYLQAPGSTATESDPEFDIEDDSLLQINTLPEPNTDISGYTYMLSGMPESEFVVDGSYYYVKDNTIEVRETSSLTSDVVETITKDSQVLRLSTYGDWAKIRLEDGKEGYCFTNQLLSAAQATPTPTPSPTATPSPTVTPTGKPTATPKPTKKPTATPTTKPGTKPTVTKKPTSTPKPTATTKPTATVKPTATAKPTATVKPTATTKPTATPKPTSSEPSVKETEYSATVYTTTTLNVRKGPGTNYAFVKKLTAGTKVTVVAKTDNGWYKNSDGYYLSAEFTTTKAPTPAPTPSGHDTSLPFDEYVKTFLGIPYVFGSSSATAADCSGLTKYVFSKYYGIYLPHSASSQYLYGTAVNLNEVKCGDLIFFDYTKDGKIDHVGIYIGNNTVIHASDSRGKVVSTSYSAMTCKFGARRIA